MYITGNLKQVLRNTNRTLLRPRRSLLRSVGQQDDGSKQIAKQTQCIEQTQIYYEMK